MAGFEITNKSKRNTWKILIMRMAAVFFLLISVWGAYLSVFDVGILLLEVIPGVGAALLITLFLCWKGKYQKLRVLFGCIAVIAVLYQWHDRILGGLALYVNNYVSLMNQFYRTNLLSMAAEVDAEAAFFVLGLLTLLFSIILWAELETKKGKLFAVFMMLLPVILAAVVGEMPGIFWCWCLISSGVFYMIICNMEENMFPVKEIGIAVVILGVLWILSTICTPIVYKYKAENLDAYEEVKTAIIESQQIDWDEIAARFIPEAENFGGGKANDGELASITGFHQTGKVIMELVLEEKPTKAVYHGEFIGAYYTGDRWLPPETDEYSSEVYIHGYDYENLEQLTAICQNMNQMSPETVSSVINRIYADGFRYEPHPGKMPEERGFVEGFLFVKKEGFCVHFATAATMIYRLCTWPARYVEGYRIEPEAFKLQEDGTYKAIVTDYMGHAWCETYEGNGSWKVREHTIASPENEVIATPAATPESEHIEENLPEIENDEQQEFNPSENDAKGTDDNVSTIGGSNGPQNVGNSAAFLRILQTFAGIIFIIAGIVLIFVLQQKMRRARKLAMFKVSKENMGIRSIYSAIHELCDFAGGHKPMTSDMQTEIQRVKQLASQYKQLSEEEWLWIYDCAERAAYSGQILTKEENKEMYHLYRKLRGEILKELSTGQKMWFLYIRVF